MPDAWHCPEHGTLLQDEGLSWYCSAGPHAVSDAVLAASDEPPELWDVAAELAEGWSYLRNLAEPA